MPLSKVKPEGQAHRIESTVRKLRLILMALYANSPAARYTVLAILSLFVAANFIGNTLVCLVVLRNRSMRTAMNIILLNLALCDIVVAIGMTSKYILTELITHPRGDSGRYLCTFVTSGNLTWVGGLASVFCLVSLSYERFSAIVNPYEIHKRTSKRKAKVFCVLAWIASALICIPEFIGHQYNEEKKGCSQTWPLNWLPKAYSLFWLFVVGIIPSTSMVYYYSRIVFSLWIQARGTYALAQQAVLKYRKGVTKMLIIISVTYVIGWMPTLSVFVLVYWHPGFHVGQVIGAVTAVLVVFNSAVNPYVYALQSKEFRKRLKQYIICCRCHLEVHPINSLPVHHSGLNHDHQEHDMKHTAIQLRSFKKRTNHDNKIDKGTFCTDTHR